MTVGFPYIRLTREVSEGFYSEFYDGSTWDAAFGVSGLQGLRVRISGRGFVGLGFWGLGFRISVSGLGPSGYELTS